MQVGLGPHHIVLDADPAPFPQRGTAPPIIEGGCAQHYYIPVVAK